MTEISTTFIYLNHKDSSAVRHINPSSLDWIATPGFGYEPGWFLTGYDLDKKAIRSFALKNIVVQDQTKMLRILLRVGQ